MKLRLVAASAVVVSAGVHLQLWHEGFRYLPTIGNLFLLNAAGGIVIALLLLAWRHWAPPVLAICFGGATLGAFTMATTVGLFGDHEIWQGRYVFIAAAVELIAIIAGSALVLTFDDEEPAPSARTRGRHSAAIR